MPGGIDGVGNTPLTPTNTSDNSSAKQPEGNYRGQKVVQGSQAQPSPVQESFEELTAVGSEKASKKLAQRKAKTKGGGRAQEIFEKYGKHIGKVTQPEKFQQLADSLKQSADPSAGEVLKQLRDFLEKEGGGGLGGGEAALLLALEELTVAEGGNDKLVAALREAKQQVGESLRDFYENKVQTYEGTNEVYKQLVGQHGEKDFMESTGLMLKKLGADVQAGGSKLDSTELKAKLDSLYHLEVARNTYLAFNDLATKMEQFSTAA